MMYALKQCVLALLAFLSLFVGFGMILFLWSQRETTDYGVVSMIMLGYAVIFVMSGLLLGRATIIRLENRI
tara:strand:+ start:1553 stop:1765 length:213 start_codon:yes stop_codon:yes gene_type:complete